MAQYTLGSFTFNGDLFTIKDTTYENKTAVEGGVEVSLVSTGDKYAWNSKQNRLISGTNIKTINNTSLLGSGNIAVQGVLVSGTNIKTINNTSLLGSGNIAVQEVLVSGTNIKTINGVSLLGSGNIDVGGGGGGGDYTAGVGINISAENVISALSNGVNQPGIVSAPTSSNPNKIWGTDSTGAPSWRNRDSLSMGIDGTDSHQLNISFTN